MPWTAFPFLLPVVKDSGFFQKKSLLLPQEAAPPPSVTSAHWHMDFGLAPIGPPLSWPGWVKKNLPALLFALSLQVVWVSQLQVFLSCSSFALFFPFGHRNVCCLLCEKCALPPEFFLSCPVTKPVIDALWMHCCQLICLSPDFVKTGLS